MCLANEIRAVRRKKFLAIEIQRDGQMAALVFVRDQFTLIIREKAQRGFAIAKELKLARLAIGQFVRTRDFHFAHARKVRSLASRGKHFVAGIYRARG